MKYSNVMGGDAYKNEAFRKFRELKKILDDKSLNTLQKATLAYRLFPTPDSFKSKFYHLIEEKNKFACDNKADIVRMYRRLCIYEKSGLLEEVKKDEKFRVRTANYIDSRVVIRDYINDFDSYKTDEFLNKYRITKDNFNSCVTLIKKHYPELYEKYLIAARTNDDKKIVMPAYQISRILEGIKTGRTDDGEKFDAIEFWKLNPFKTNRIDFEIKQLYKYNENLKNISKLNQRTHQEGVKNIGYFEFFTNFIELLGIDPNKEVKKFMLDNNIKYCTMTNKNEILTKYRTYEDDLINESDIKKIVDIMEKDNIPFVMDAFNRLLTEYRYKKEVLKGDAKPLAKELSLHVNKK